MQMPVVQSNHLRLSTFQSLFLICGTYQLLLFSPKEIKSTWPDLCIISVLAQEISQERDPIQPSNLKNSINARNQHEPARR
jgi:hypothetical protein